MNKSRHDRAKRLQALAKNQPMVRRVYVLDHWLLDRIQDHQERRVLRSEVAAVRELLEEALRVKGY